MDTITYKIPESDYKVVAYFDSVGCMSCKLKLFKWKQFIEEIETLSNKDIPLIFFFYPKDVKELQRILRRDDFSIPICIDVEDNFNSLNHFPPDMMFQTFLIDKNNRVRVIGNPINDLSVKEAYFREIVGVTNETAPYTIIHTDKMKYDFDIVKKDSVKKQVVSLYNAGEQVFFIKGITTSCDCLNVKYDWNKIVPGESEVISVYYKGEEKGHFWRTITIYGNIPTKYVTLDFVGIVR